MPPDPQIELHDRVRCSECGIHIAVPLANDHGLGAVARRKLRRRLIGAQEHRQLLDRHRNKVGGVFRLIIVLGEHSRDRLAHIAHMRLCQDRLPIRFEALDLGSAKLDGRNFRDIRSSPHRHASRRRECLARVDGGNPAMSVGGAHDAHVELMGK
jgi:hypothetical protein